MLQSFLKEIEKEAEKIFPDATIDYKIVRSTHLYFRIKIDKATLIDIYFNTETQRKDFSLIFRNKRVYGIDNLLNWHQHPYNSPDTHIPLPEPSIKEILAEMRKVVDMFL